jgi:hypothetical protein
MGRPDCLVAARLQMNCCRIGVALDVLKGVIVGSI